MISITELARGRSRGNPKQSVCVLADIRGPKTTKYLPVWSYGNEAKGRQPLINLPLSQMTNHMPSAKRWAAVSIPRWLADNEGLWGGEPEMIPGDSERAEAEDIIAIKNRDILRPGQRLSGGGGMGRVSNAGT